MSNKLGGVNFGLSYRGTSAPQPPNWNFEQRDPTIYDTENYVIGDLWLNKVTEVAWVLLSLEGTSTSKGMLADWVKWAGGAGSLLELSGNIGINPVFPDSSGNINIIGDGVTANVSGDGINTLTVSLVGSGGAAIENLKTDDGNVVTPTVGQIIIAGGTGINTTGTVGPNTVTINVSSVIADSYVCDTGTAIPSLNILQVKGGTNITTTGSGNLISISTSGASADSFVTDSGTATPLAGVLDILGGTGIATSGSGHTVTVTAAATVPLIFHTDSGDATPAANAITVHGTGTTTTSGSGSTITINSTGSVPAASCAFFAYNNADQSSYFVDGVFKTIQFPATLFNVGSAFNTSTYTFSAPNTGYYALQAAVSLINVNSTDIEYSLMIVTTAGNHLYSNGNPFSMSDMANTSVGINESIFIHMTSGDTALVQFLVHGTVGTTGISGTGGSLGSQYRTIFSGYQVA